MSGILRTSWTEAPQERVDKDGCSRTAFHAQLHVPWPQCPKHGVIEPGDGGGESQNVAAATAMIKPWLWMHDAYENFGQLARGRQYKPFPPGSMKR